ncbi:MAG: hypothetical protein Q7W02_05490 [Candidatus Rokubacteria bacterium]|nr:hypothetical protein [Candidatus Rokubacteria bacterium]
MAPVYEAHGGVPYLVSGWERKTPKLISVGEGVSRFVAFDSSEQFYLINLAKLRQDVFWRQRFDLYISNVRNSTDPRARPVHFERLLFNIIRRSRYSAPAIEKEDRERFKAATFEELKRRGNDCGSRPDLAACILNVAFMETELGKANPLSVSDALDNSGLAFGPRQLDLGQGRNDARKFAADYLIDKTDAEEADWSNRFLRPIEAMRLRDLRIMYSDVTRRFNDRLGIHGDRVIEVYATGLLEMANADYKLATIRFSGKAELLARLLAADFSNKWGEAAVVRIVAFLRAREQPYGECALLGTWREGVEKYFRPDDVKDFKRRATIVKTWFAKAVGADLSSCGL